MMSLSVALALAVNDAPMRERVAIPGTALAIDLVRVPAPGEGSAGPMLVSVTEIPWELYDCFIYGLDEPRTGADGATSGGASASGTGAQADAVTRPTKPYISVDRGFGHAGWPAISMSFRGATAFCTWLEAKTGRPFRLPTVSEWRSLCAASADPSVPLEERAWVSANAGGKTHKIGSRKADALGLHDLCGNVAEWCVAEDGKGVVLGGSYRDPPDRVGCESLERDTPNWNRSDPQFPKSVWWLADAPHVGMRVVCSAPKPDAAAARGAATPAHAPEQGNAEDQGKRTP
jgi:hypothetical protein